MKFHLYLNILPVWSYGNELSDFLETSLNLHAVRDILQNHLILHEEILSDGFQEFSYEWYPRDPS